MDSQATDFTAYEHIDAWDVGEAALTSAPTALSHAALVDEATPCVAVDAAKCGFFLLAFIAGNSFFDWFAPACNASEMLLVGGGALLALRLFFTQPLLALVLAFGIGDPLLDTYGHCVMGL